MPKTKKALKKNPMAVVAVGLVIAVIFYLFVATLVAFYKDATGVSCAGLYGARDSCVATLYLGLSVYLLNPVTLFAGLIAIFLLGYDAVTKKGRKKR